MYNIKNYKTFKGHEGEPCAQGSMHGSKGKVAEWSDDSWGGPMRIDFTHKEDEKAFLEWAKTQVVQYKDYNGAPYDAASMTDWDIIETVVASMSYAHAEQRQLEKFAKKGIAYYLPDPKAPDGKALYTWNAQYTAKNVATLRSQHPNADIINERLKMPLVDDATADLAARNKRYKTLCRNATVFTLRKDDGTTADMKLGVPYSAVIAASLRAKHGAKMVEIINERFL
jgi:hypothetical protein